VLALAAEERLTVGPVYDIVDVLADEHYRARETVVEMDDGTVLTNAVPRLSGTPREIRLPAPPPGSTTRRCSASSVSTSTSSSERASSDPLHAARAQCRTIHSGQP
jgi:crotonobetainyl-CoA:carnitine CoA-transferase CaiB-like acyl-CoA transferase